EWTRYATVPLAMVQALMWIKYMLHQGIVASTFRGPNLTAFWIVSMFTLTAGSIFLMWLGEQIDEYGLGNGISLIILAGIVARMPGAVGQLIYQSDMTVSGGGEGKIGPGKILFLMAAFVFIVAGSILITQAQRRIPIQQAKHTRGRRIYGGQRQYLPLRVNHGGVMPIIFAQSLMLFPGVLFGKLAEWTSGHTGHDLFDFLNREFNRGSFLNIITEIVMIYFFAYFWTTVQF